MTATDLLRPAFLLAAWTLVITTWMFVTRIPTMAKLQIDPLQSRRADPAQTQRNISGLPAHRAATRW